MSRNVRNELLKNLPEAELSLVFGKLEHVDLVLGETLYEPFETVHSVYFPEDCLISLISVTTDGLTVEAGSIGCEGILGISAIFSSDSLPYRATVQADGAAYKVPIKTLRRLLPEAPTLNSHLLSYLPVIHAQVAQSAICNKFHTVRERVAKWLLLSTHRTESTTLRYTQEFLSMLLGSGRTSISRALAHLQSIGLIRTRRANVTVVRPKHLEEIACECYKIISMGFPQC